MSLNVVGPLRRGSCEPVKGKANGITLFHTTVCGGVLNGVGIVKRLKGGGERGEERESVQPSKAEKT